MRKQIATFALVVGSLFAPAIAQAQWNGCGGGIYGAFLDGNVEIASPVSLSAQGQKAGVTLNCDAKLQAFVLGAEVDYGKVLGDLHDLGVKTDLTLTGRFGVLINQGSLLYAHAGWSRLDTDFGKMDGWKLGLGNEFRVPNSPVYLDLRYTYASYDLKDLIPSAPNTDTFSHEFRLGLKVKFGPGMFGGTGKLIVADDNDHVPEICDPKLANCKKR